jgi:hypothetical protein
MPRKSDDSATILASAYAFGAGQVAQKNIVLRCMKDENNCCTSDGGHIYI